mmetsp:Transcript_43812/g.131338  ORF Transcript_43812/g.131338 Transcript_43812/m.131338 type:complete len:204 (-) Transcript_43812:30-641(-)
MKATFSAPRTTATTLAPSILPIWHAATPTPPAAPITSSVWPSCSRARSTSARCAVPYTTGTAAAASRSMPSGSLNTAVSGTDTFSEKAPPIVTATTRSPGLMRRTPGPVAATTPDTSEPGTNGSGGFTWYKPCTMSASGKLMLAAATSISTSPCPTSGAGRCSTLSTPRPMGSVGSPRAPQTTERIAVGSERADVACGAHCSR